MLETQSVSLEPPLRTDEAERPDTAGALRKGASLPEQIRHVFTNEEGASMAEHALILPLIVMACIRTVRVAFSRWRR